MKAKPKIYADFQKLDDSGRLVLICRGTHEDIRKQNLKLFDGMEVVFYSDDADKNGDEDELRVDGIIQFDKRQDVWVGIYDPTKFRHASDE